MKKLSLLLISSLLALVNAKADNIELVSESGVRYELNLDYPEKSKIIGYDHDSSELSIHLSDKFNYNGTTYTTEEVVADAFADSPIKYLSIAKGIKKIGSRAFYNCNKLEQVWFYHEEDDKLELGSNIFEYCTQLSAIDMPQSIKTVTAGMFKFCASLPSITLPASVEEIHSIAFENCVLMKWIELPTNLTVLHSDAFRNCDLLETIYYNAVNCTETKGEAFSGLLGLKEVICSDDVKSIPQRMFKDCKYLSNVKFPEQLKYIGRYAFDGCTSLKDVQLGYYVEHIDTCAFRNSGVAGTIKLDHCMTKVGAGAFEACTYLKSVEMAESEYYIDIDENAFVRCTSLEEIQMVERVKTIKDGAFTATSIRSLYIPASVAYIGRNIVQNVNELTSITVADANTIYDSRDNCNAIIKTSSNTLIIGTHISSIPSTVTAIDDFAFYLASMESIDIPDSVKTIGEQAFYGCQNLKSVRIGVGMENIGKWAFYNSLNIRDVVVDCQVPPTCYSDLTFYNDVYAKGSLYVPEGTADAYSTATTWKKFNQVVGVDGVMVDDNAVEVERYDLNGCRLTEPAKGINIIKMSNGKVKKEYVR